MPDGYRIIAAATRPNRQGLTVQARTTRPRSEMRDWIRPSPLRWLGIPIDRGDMPGGGSDWIWYKHRNLEWPAGTSGRYSTETPPTPGNRKARRCWATSRRCFPTRPKKAVPPISSRREDGTPHSPQASAIIWCKSGRNSGMDSSGRQPSSQGVGQPVLIGGVQPGHGLLGEVAASVLPLVVLLLLRRCRRRPGAECGHLQQRLGQGPAWR